MNVALRPRLRAYGTLPGTSSLLPRSDAGAVRDRARSPLLEIAARAIPPFLALAVLLLPAGALANFVPEATLLFHVQPLADPLPFPCHPVAGRCEEITPSTREDGIVEFYLIARKPPSTGENSVIHSVDLALQWPDAWSLQWWKTCHGAIGSLEVEQDHHRLRVRWPECPRISLDLFEVATLVLQVDGFGRLEPWGAADIEWGCPPETERRHYWMPGAEAGVICTRDMRVCSYPDRCEPILSTQQISLSVTTGGSTSTEIPVRAMWNGSASYCNPETSSLASWLTADLRLEGEVFLLALRANASALAIGQHQGWIEVFSDPNLVRCLRVDLTVRPLTPVREQTWGAMKSRFR